MTFRTTTFLAAALFISATLASAQTPAPVTKMGEQVKVTATIVQIDSTARLITFKSDAGVEDTVLAGPAVQRFNELKVGDKVTFTYYESMVFSVRKPGDPPIAARGGAALTPSQGAMPGGTVSAQKMTTVTVKAVDASTGVLTVATEDGRTVHRKVDNKSNLNGVKVGDKIDIVYTEAMVTSVAR